MAERIFLSSPAMNGSEIKYIQEAFDSNWVAPLGKNVDEFENELASYVDVGYAAALSSGTAAIHLALKSAGVGPGDIVFCSDLTFSASCNPIKYENAIPVFIDSERESWNMSPELLEKAFRKYPKAKAVIVVNLYGTPARLDAIVDICKAYNAVVIEDAAESLGSTLDGKQTGSFGHMGAFSFNGNKIITTSGGGMLVSNDKSVIKKAYFWATQSRDPAPHYQHSELGYNYRMSNICAGIGRGQMNTLSERICQKTDIYRRYQRAFKDNHFIEMNPVPNNTQSNHWLSCITLKSGCAITPTRIMERLAKENVESRPVWKPMSMQPYYKNCDFIAGGANGCSVSSDIFGSGLCLPSDVNMTSDKQDWICDMILDMF